MTSQQDLDQAGEGSGETVSAVEGERCITCSDEAIIGVLMSHPNAAALTPLMATWGDVITETGKEKVSLWMVPGAMVGDRLLIQAGVAIADLGPEPDEAKPEELDDLDDKMDDDEMGDTE